MSDQKSNLEIHYVDVGDQPPQSESGLTLAIRTDARHATAGLKKNLIEHLREAPLKSKFNLSSNQTPPEHDDNAPVTEEDLGEDSPVVENYEASEASEHRGETLDEYIERVVHNAYRDWGHKSLQLMADTLNYDKYDLENKDDHEINVHFYNAGELASEVASRAQQMGNGKAPVFMISLDDMITNDNEYFGEIGFSRLFSLDGRTHSGYVGRPGKKPIDDQLADVAKAVADIKSQYGEDVPIVLLEDNVRHAKMLNWVIELMDEAGVFEASYVAGISTCFICATEEERQNILFDGNPVPIEAIVDYEDTVVDVVTPRDLLFDGIVVKVDEKLGRLPGIFMDVEERFKVRPGKAAEFNQRIREINAEFCQDLEDELGIEIPVSWFDGGRPIAYVTEVDEETRMKDIMTGDKGNHNHGKPQPN